MKVNYLFVGLFLIGIIGAISVNSFENNYPSYFPKPIYIFENNALDSAKIELGRALFYDPILSKNNTISCASCHSPYNAFAHTDHELSHGIHDSIGFRNAPALFNLAWQEKFMWDGAINHLDVQALAPIHHPNEMGENIKNVVQKLKNATIYLPLFEKAFSSKEITGEFVLKALAQFQVQLISGNSKYDKVKQGKETFTIQEKNGYQLFKKSCNSCHTEPLFSNYSFQNNGLSVDTTLNDYGRWVVTKKSIDSLKFKVPSLRNLSYTYPYMHDGRFKKLQDVLTHYTEGIEKHPTLSKQLTTSIQLTSNEKVDLIAFLKTLNDNDFIFNPKNQFPKNILLKNEGK